MTLSLPPLSKTVIFKILQGSVATQTVLGGLTNYTSSSCKFPRVYLRLYRCGEIKRDFSIWNRCELPISNRDSIKPWRLRQPAPSTVPVVPTSLPSASKETQSWWMALLADPARTDWTRHENTSTSRIVARSGARLWSRTGTTSGCDQTLDDGDIFLWSEIRFAPRQHSLSKSIAPRTRK